MHILIHNNKKIFLWNNKQKQLKTICWQSRIFLKSLHISVKFTKLHLKNIIIQRKMVFNLLYSFNILSGRIFKYLRIDLLAFTIKSCMVYAFDSYFFLNYALFFNRLPIWLFKCWRNWYFTIKFVINFNIILRHCLRIR